MHFNMSVALWSVLEDGGRDVAVVMRSLASPLLLSLSKSTRMKDLIYLILLRLPSALSSGKMASGKQTFLRGIFKRVPKLQFT